MEWLSEWQCEWLIDGRVDGRVDGLVLESLETKFNATTFIGQAAEGVNFHAAFNRVLE